MVTFCWVANVLPSCVCISWLLLWAAVVMWYSYSQEDVHRSSAVGLLGKEFYRVILLLALLSSYCLPVAHLSFCCLEFNGHCNCWCSSSHLGTMKTQKLEQLGTKDGRSYILMTHWNSMLDINVSSLLFFPLTVLLFVFSVNTATKPNPSLTKYSVSRFLFLEAKQKNSMSTMWIFFILHRWWRLYCFAVNPV